MNRIERFICKILDYCIKCHSCGVKHTRLGYHEDEL